MTIDRSTRAKSQIADWNRDTEAYDPRPTLERVKVLVLALNGETDLHVASKLNLELIAAGLKTGGNKDVTTVFFPKLNHLFQTSQTGRLTEYGEIEERIALVVLETISIGFRNAPASKNKRRKTEQDSSIGVSTLYLEFKPHI